METFTKSQLDFINDIKKTLGSGFVWKFLEYLRIENELGHTPSIEELVSNAGETTAGSWCIAVGSLKEAGFITKKSRVETVEDMLWKSEFLDLLWSIVKPHMNDNGFASIDNKGRAENAVKMACDTKAKNCEDKADIIEECLDKTFKKIQHIWDSQFNTEQINSI